MVLLLVGRANAQDVPLEVRRLRFHEEGKSLAATIGFTDAFDARLLQGLDSGFATTVLLRAYVIPRNDVRPVAFAAATCRIAYDLWEENYLVQRVDARGSRTIRVPTRADALREATSLVGLPIAPLSSIRVGSHYALHVLVEVNPVSSELVSDVRRWLTRRRGEDPTGNSFFGSFVSIFVNPKIEHAERILRFRSQYFYRPRGR